jgi:hypothetical protein
VLVTRAMLDDARGFQHIFKKEKNLTVLQVVLVATCSIHCLQ